MLRHSEYCRKIVCFENYSVNNFYYISGVLANTFYVLVQIPKTTLFREKVRLVERGILPLDSIKRRKGDADYSRSMRVEQAVAACKEGKMSQSAAAAHFQVRREQLQQFFTSQPIFFYLLYARKRCHACCLFPLRITTYNF